jgi:AcrR family transcriptional regulator
MVQSLSRAEQRAAENRKRLLHGALKAFVEHGVQHATIAQITEAAGLGFGTFYNYFESKEMAVEAIKETYINRFVARLQAMKADLDDPAERIAAAVRHAMRKAMEEPLWVSFHLQSALLTNANEDPMVLDFVQDFMAGHTSGRFVANGNPGVKVAAALGISIGVYYGIINGVLDGEDLPSETATTVLLALGLSTEEAQELASRPLPDLPEQDGERALG